MRTRRGPIGAAALLAVVCLAHASQAATTPRCPTFTDPRGDVYEPIGGAGRALDVVKATYSGDAKNVTATIQVDDLNPETSPAFAYEADFTLGGHYLFLQGTILPGGNDFYAFEATGPADQSRAATGIGPIQGVVDTRHDRIVLTAPLTLFARYGMRTGQQLTQLSVYTWRANGASTQSTTGSVAEVSAAGGMGADQAATSQRLGIGTRCRL